MNALIIIDVQHDFLPGGALAVKDGDQVIPVIKALSGYDVVVATQDWHPANHKSFVVNNPGRKVGDVIELDGLSQVMWPAHCVQNTRGAELAISGFSKIFQKGTNAAIDSYSGFFDNGHRQATGMGAWLQARGVKKVTLCGLATDYCVKFTALDAQKLGFETEVIVKATRGVELQPGDVARALNDMRAAGVRLMGE